MGDAAGPAPPESRLTAGIVRGNYRAMRINPVGGRYHFRIYSHVSQDSVAEVDAWSQELDEGLHRCSDPRPSGYLE